MPMFGFTPPTCFSFFGSSAIATSVVRSMATAEEAFSTALRVTFIGSIIPAENMSVTKVSVKGHRRARACARPPAAV